MEVFEYGPLELDYLLPWDRILSLAIEKDRDD